MAANENIPAIEGVLAALDALYKNPDNSAKQQANTWLQDFQKTPEAWQTANALLLSQDLPLEPRLFAAQTFRVKSTYDVDQIPRETLPSLRATLITALRAYKSGPKVIQTQICLALAGLALQLRDGEDREWGDNVVGSMIEQFGKDPSDVSILLEFLTVLPEEITMNQRIPIDNDHYNARSYSLLQVPALDVLQILSVYIQAQGITESIQSSVFACLASWLKAGEMNIQSLLPSPLFKMSFDCLANEQLFDGAVDVVCDIINETQEVQENQEAIQLIVSRLLPLRSELQQAIQDEDDDKVRGLCRIFVQAGETYHTLMLPHKDVFFPIAEAIFACAGYHDLDIVQITFRFWYFLAGDITRDRNDESAYAFAPVYQQLLEVIVKHLKFPDNLDNWSGQERDDFKSFRHYMGDTLKDCCQVLGSQTCLARSLSMIQEVLGGNAKWQDVEAPLFSMRAMGARADPRDDEVLPRIMDVIPNLPSHPRLTYAALLVISRYTEWVKYHPDRIPMILSYISAGFQSGDIDVAAAAAQAFKYLGQDCDVELAPFLPQLYEFYQAIVDGVDPEDGRSIAEAIGYVIAALPAEQATEPLMRFTQPLLQNLSVIANANAGSLAKADLQKAADRMEQIDALVRAVGGKIKSTSLPPSCSQTCKEAFDIIDEILVKHGSTFFITERSCELLRRGIAFFDVLAAPVVPALLERLANSFEVTGYPSYIWIVGKTIDTFGQQTPEIVAGLEKPMGTAFERVSVKVHEMINSSNANGKSIVDISDVIDDYIHTCTAVSDTLPSQLFLSGVFPASFGIATDVLRQMYQLPILTATLDFVRSIVGHDAFDVLQNNQSNGPSQFGGSHMDPNVANQYVTAIRSVLQGQGAALISALLQGTVTTFEPESLPNTTTIIRLLTVNVSGIEAVQAWVAEGLNVLNDSIISPMEKQKCLTTLTEGGVGAIKAALQGLYNASRKSRERDRLDRQSSLLEQ